jgi:glucose/arabinose dehydrogenase
MDRHTPRADPARRFFGVALLALGLLAPAAAPAAVPAGFSDTLLVNLAEPTALTFTPDGRMLITTQDGQLRVFAEGSLLATPALDLAAPPTRVCTNSERGLLGVALHPQFAANGHLYLFYTFRRPDQTCVNRVSRFTLDENVIDPESELVLIDNMPSPVGQHNAGDLEIGRDGYLYVAVGDGGTDYAGDSGSQNANDAARDLHALVGKVLRITDDGGIPPGNPFQGAGTARCNVDGLTTPGTTCQETFAWGLRNPFRFAFDPNDPGTRFFVNDVGTSHYEEVNLGQAGADYGFNVCEGTHVAGTHTPCLTAPPGMVSPLFEYAHDATVPGTSEDNCGAVTGGAFVPNGLWPGFDGVYLAADLVCGAIFRLTELEGQWTAADFAAGLGIGSVVHLRFGPHGDGQALYYATYAGGGQVRRISYDQPPAVAGPLDFFAVSPCRVVDTRGGDAPRLGAGVARSFAVAGGCGVPTAARAVALNVTVVDPTTGTYLRLYSTDEIGTNAAIVRYLPPVTRANNATVMLGADGALTALADGAIDLVLDVVGWYE